MASTWHELELILATCATLACAAPAAAAWRGQFLYPDSHASAADVAVDAAGDVVVAGGWNSGTGSGGAPVAKYDGGTGEEVWRGQYSGPTLPATFRSVAVDSAGDLVVGAAVSSGSTNDLAVYKFAGANGTELWRTLVHVGHDDVRGVALDASGDVFAAGSLSILNTARDVIILKLDGATGAELWRHVITATTNDSNYVTTIAVDGSGDLVVGGVFVNTSSIMKLAGATGTVTWTQAITGGNASEIALDGGGDLFVAGSASSTTGTDFAVFRFAGSTGAELWRYTTSGTSAYNSYDGAAGVALDSAGDVVAAGSLDNRATFNDIVIVKVAGTTGTEVWRSVISGSTDPYSYEVARSVIVDGADDVITGGDLGERRREYPAAFKHSGATGAEIWRQVFGGWILAPLPGGDAVAAGSRNLARLSGLDGGIGSVAGRTLQVRDRTGDTTAELLLGLLIDPSIRVPPPGSIGDPTLGGATVRLVNRFSGESATIAIPGGSGWQAVGSPPGVKGWRYRDLTGAGGPCKSVLARPGKLKALCQGTQGTIPFSLDEPTQAVLTFSLQLGGAAPQCTAFGGTIRRDQGAGAPGETGYFLAAEAPAALGGCP
jgi:hypothetical protein